MRPALCRINKMAKMLRRLSWLLFLMSGIMVFFAVPFYSFWPHFRLPPQAVISIGLTLLTATAYLARSGAGEALRQLSPGGQAQGSRCFLLILLLGVSLRVGWVHVVPRCKPWIWRSIGIWPATWWREASMLS